MQAAFETYVHDGTKPEVNQIPIVAAIIADSMLRLINAQMKRWGRQHYPGTFGNHYMSFNCSTMQAKMIPTMSCVVDLQNIARRFTNTSICLMFRCKRRSNVVAERVQYHLKALESRSSELRFILLKKRLLELVV